MATAYIASPLGFTAAGLRYNADVLIPAIRHAGLDPLDPWSDPNAPREVAAARRLAPGEQRLDAFRVVNRRLGEANARMIARADGMLAILDGADVDSGTAAEVGFACAHGKPIVGLRADVRQTGDNEAARVNLQVEYFIIATGGDVVRTLDAALELLTQLLLR